MKCELFGGCTKAVGLLLGELHQLREHQHLDPHTCCVSPSCHVLCLQLSAPVVLSPLLTCVLLSLSPGGRVWVCGPGVWPAARDNPAHPAHQHAAAPGSKVCAPAGQELGSKTTTTREEGRPNNQAATQAVAGCGRQQSSSGDSSGGGKWQH